MTTISLENIVVSRMTGKLTARITNFVAFSTMSRTAAWST